MIKAFISHSSSQKDFVLELAENLGRDFCIVDCYNFEPAFRTIDEIYKRIEQSTIFVLLLSKESLDSEWVNSEIKLARQKLDSDNLDKFWPYIIDPNISVQDCPEWIRKDECFNLKKIHSPKMLARDIEQKFRRIIWSMDSKIKKLDTLMIGRNSDIDAFENIVYSSRASSLRSMIISGRDGVGKDMFISQCLMKMGYDPEVQPFSISLGSNEDVENFIIQVNLITRTYTENEVKSILSKSTSEKSKTAVSLLNEVLDSNTVLTIDDDMSCIRQNRNLSEWFVDLVENCSLNNQLGLFVKSKKIIKSFVETEHPSVGHISLEPLDTKDRKKLFYKLLGLYNKKDVSEDDVNWFVERLLLSPSQIVKVVEQLTKFSVNRVKEDIDDLIHWGDKQIKPFISKFTSDEESKYLLIILSKLEYISYELLEKIYEERIVESIKLVKEFMDYGIVVAFGPNEQFFRLDHYFSDYIKRCHIALPKDFEMRLNEVLEDTIASSSSITEDVSVFLYQTKQRIMKGKMCSDDFLIPSVVVASVMEIYNKREYHQVIKVCDQVLSDVHNYYPEQERELRYWLCLALARVTNERFFIEVKPLNDVDQYFLRGFYSRIALDFKSAEKWQRKALSISPNFARAKRELVAALLALRDYGTALSIAKENYEEKPENSYQIHGYFRCLVKKDRLSHDDIITLKNLMDAMKNNLSDKHEELYSAMNIEFQLYVNHRNPAFMFNIIKQARDQFPYSINIDRAAQPFYYKQGIIKEEKIFEEDY